LPTGIDRQLLRQDGFELCGNIFIVQTRETFALIEHICFDAESGERLRQFEAKGGGLRPLPMRFATGGFSPVAFWIKGPSSKGHHS
jgi:hypothetical protein